MLSSATNYPATMLLSCKSGGFEGFKSSDLSKNQNDMQSLMMSNSCTPAENLLLIVELRKKILTFRDIIDLPTCDDHGPINELVSGTVEDLHKLYPKYVHRTSMSELNETSTHQVLSKLYNALTSIGDSWINNHKWMSKFKYEKQCDIKNISLGQLGDRVLAKLDYMIMVARELFDVMDESGRNSDVSPRNSSFGDILMESYSDTKASPCRSPNTPTSVIPELASTFADVSYSPPLLWPLRLQAVGKLKPIDVKRLSFHILPHAVTGKSSPEHAMRALDEVEPEKKRAKSMAVTDTNIEVKGPKNTEAAREVLMSDLDAVSCSRNGVENSVAPSTMKAPPLPPPMPQTRQSQESQKTVPMKATEILPQSITRPSNVSRVPSPLPASLPSSPMKPSNADSVTEAYLSSPTAFTEPPPPMLQESATPQYVILQPASAAPAPPSPVPTLPKTISFASPPPPPPPPFTSSRNTSATQTPPPPPTLLTLSKTAPAAPSLSVPQPPPPPTCSKNAAESLPVAPPVGQLNAPKIPLPPPPPAMLQANTSTTLPPPPPPMFQIKGSTSPPPPPPPMLQPNASRVPPPPPMLPSNGSVPLPPPPMLQPNASRAPPPPPMLPSNGSVPSPPPPMSLSNGSAPPPPPPGAARALLRPKKANTKLKRSTHMGNLYRVLKGKVEGINQDNKASSPRKNIGGGAGGSKQSMADALAEMTKRSSYFQQIEEDVEKHSKTIMEVKTKINSFQTTDMAELLKFHQNMESHLEKLTDETQVLARFEDFPTKKLETLRTAAALYSKLDAMVTTLTTWKIETPLRGQLDKVESYFNKIKGEVDALDRTKDDEAKRFQTSKINFDFNILVRIKEAMVDLSSSCMEFALQERREAKAASDGETGSKTEKKLKACTKMLWRAFQLAFRVYTFAGGHDDRADMLSRELAQEIQSDPNDQ